MQPDFKAILSIDSARAIADVALQEMGLNPDYFSQVLELALSEKSPLNWRASRVIDYAVRDNPFLFFDHADRIAPLFPSFTNDGLKRSFLSAFKQVVNRLSEENLEIIIADSFDKLMDSKEKIAVRYYAALLLFEISKREPDIRGELQACLEFSIAEGHLRSNGKVLAILKAIR